MIIFMTLEDKKKILFEFLDKNNLTESFNNTVTRFYQIGEDCQEVCDISDTYEDVYFDSVDDYIESSDLHYMITGIGYWSETEEGSDFWLDVNNEWYDCIAKIDL